MNDKAFPPQKVFYDGEVLDADAFATRHILASSSGVRRKPKRHLRGFSSRLMVAKAGIEPATHGFSVRCAEMNNCQ